MSLTQALSTTGNGGKRDLIREVKGIGLEWMGKRGPQKIQNF